MTLSFLNRCLATIQNKVPSIPIPFLLLHGTLTICFCFSLSFVFVVKLLPSSSHCFS